MRRLVLVLLATVLFVAACGDDGSSADESFDPPSSDLPEGAVVFTPDDTETDTQGEATTWTPTADDVAAADELLADHLADHPELGLDPLDTYHRQYVGVGPDDGHLVSVNALCEGAGLDDWEDGLIVVADGGTCFWSAHVFLPERLVSDLQVNGYA